MDARRTHALIRDERRLRTALAEQENRRFDVDTALTVKYRVEDLLETVSLIVQDDDFWSRLTGVNRPPSDQQLQRIRQLDPLAFAALLEAAGYASPPPPPVDELVDDTIQSLITTMTSLRDVEIDEVGGARWQLRTLVMRVRRQINEPEIPELAPNILRSAARSLGRAARWLIPRVVGATAGAVVEAHAPGSGLGLLASRSVQRTAEDLGELAAEMVIGDPSPALATVSVDEPPWTEIDPLAAHLALLADQLHGMGPAALPLFSDTRVELVRQLVCEARRHLNRIEEVAGDLSRETVSVADKIQAIRKALDELSRIISAGGQLSPLSRAQEEVGALREELLRQRTALGADEGYNAPMPGTPPRQPYWPGQAEGYERPRPAF
jgi:hypothetical protein